jgi:hypothetical protein
LIESSSSSPATVRPSCSNSCIRTFGLLAHRYRRRLLARCRELLSVKVAPAVEPIIESWSQRLLRLTGFDALRCPFCKAGRLQVLSSLASPAGGTPRGPP